MWIAIDAMSGDHGVDPMILGTALAVRELNAKVILVGDKTEINQRLKKYSDVLKQVRVEHAGEIITMNDSPAKAVRAKKDASVVVAAHKLHGSR